MKDNAKLTLDQVDHMRQRFTSAIDLVMNSFGGNAFHNISPTDSTRFVPKFSPTIFDSTLIAADYALQAGGITLPQNPGEARRVLLLDPAYRLAISQETMKRDSIKKRVSMACQHLFGINYEQH